MDGINDLAKALAQAFEQAGCGLMKILELFMQLDEAMRIAAKEAEKALITPPMGYEESLEELEKSGAFDYEQTARKKKRERDRRQAIERGNAARFRQYRVTETAWRARKRTGARRREYRGPDIVR